MHKLHKKKFVMNIIGPGIWYSIHLKGALATTDYLKDMFEEYINELCDNFPCKKCKKHFREFLDKNPIKNYRNIIDKFGEDIGLFKWSWMFHNDVNKRLGKDLIDYELAYQIYYTQLINCERCEELSDVDLSDSDESNNSNNKNESRYIHSYEKMSSLFNNVGETTFVNDIIEPINNYHFAKFVTDQNDKSKWKI